LRYRTHLFVIVGALVVAALVLAVLNRTPERPGKPNQALAEAGGRALGKPSLNRRVWVAAFFPDDCERGCDEIPARLDALARELSAVPLIGFALDARGDRRPTASGWWPADGSPDEHRHLAAEVGFDGAVVDALASDEARLLLACVDRAGRVHSRYDVATDASLAREQLAADVTFLVGLGSRPRWHAQLNATSALLLCTGYLFIRFGRRRLHVTFMLLAALTTVVFLASYLHYHYYAGSTSFQGQGWSRTLYFAILLSHTVLAAFVAPLVGRVFYLAARRRFSKHRQLARWTLPLWLYVSITGVLVYWMLYVQFAA